MEPIIFVYKFFTKGSNIFVTMEFFPHVCLVEDSLSLDPSDGDLTSLIGVLDFSTHH